MFRALMFPVRYFSHQPFFEAPRLQIRGIGIRETMPPCYISRPSGTGDCLLMLFHDAVHIGKPPHEIACLPSSIVLLKPDEGHFYGNSAAKWCHSWIHCDGPQVIAALEAAPQIWSRPVSLSNPARVGRYLLDIYEEISSPATADDQIVGNTLENLLLETARSVNTLRAKPTPDFLIQARQNIESHYAERLDLAALAEAAHLSPPHFCTIFRRTFGVSPIAYLIQRRMEAAAVLVHDTALDFGEIGRRVGYSDPFQFSKLFKRTFGMPPSQFRRR